MKLRLIPGFSLLLLSFTSGAQQLSQPKPSEPLHMLDSIDSSSGNSLPSPQPVRGASVRQDAAQRTDLIPNVASGPGTKVQKRAQGFATLDKSPAPPRVTDARGQLIPGAVQLGPNQVLDPRNGKIYSTVPNGDGQRIIDPPKP